MSPEQFGANALPKADSELPHAGCNCGKNRGEVHRPLLTADLVIAARDRAREPELPAATVEIAMSTPVTPRVARYDVIILGNGPASNELESRLASEFARHEHRVFHLSDHPAPDHRPTAPTLQRLPFAVDVLATLRGLRQSEQIEAAIVVSFVPLAATAIQQMREGWNWRLAAPFTMDELPLSQADVVIAFDAELSSVHSPRVVALPAQLSWPARWAELDQAFRQAWPKVSVIMLTHDNLAFNRMCLASIFENTEYPNYELIVVDNASSDGTVEELQRLKSSVRHMLVILNDQNVGFGPGNNQGLNQATGDIFVLLNNDTIVPRGWLTRLTCHLNDPKVGLIGPATNRACNEAQVDRAYQTYAEFQALARQHGQEFAGQRIAIRMPMMFCTAFRRDLYEKVGPLDERYEVGMFEDEDYALRARQAGYLLAWTPEVYVHHAYHASIGKLLPTGDYMRLVELNRGRFEEKWGICWERHRPPPAVAGKT